MGRIHKPGVVKSMRNQDFSKLTQFRSFQQVPEMVSGQSARPHGTGQPVAGSLLHPRCNQFDLYT